MSATQATSIRLCTELVLPASKRVAAIECARQERASNVSVPTGLELALIKRRMWKNGRVLRVCFTDGDPAVHDRVAHHAATWQQYANIEFEFGSDPDAEIRVAFEPGGSWSYLGTDILTIEGDRPTMNLGWLTPDSPDDEVSRIVLHEFGHVLGCIHEHQNPRAGIPWDVDKVYAYYWHTQGWDRDAVDIQILRRYAEDQTNVSAFDPASIMLYAVPAELTIGGFSTPFNTRLSDMDETFMAAMYPGASR
ncbi:MAG: hypothetical protein MJE77_23935 [Proteobacteria bacterium]|nr:hypothetical protein [Pseudomonadota bacterium]